MNPGHISLHQTLKIFKNCLPFIFSEPIVEQNIATKMFGSTVCATSKARYIMNLTDYIEAKCATLLLIIDVGGLGCCCTCK